MTISPGFSLIFAACLSVLTLPISAARANDSVAGFGVGGLELRSTDVVRMARENLRITPHLIDVRYVFRNETDRDVTLIVAFPLPAVGGDGWFEGYDLPHSGRMDYVGFQTQVDGASVTMTPEHRITLDGRDRTDAFEAIGVQAVAVHNWDIYDLARRSWTPAQIEALTAQGFLNAQGRPRWEIQSTYWREQLFPAQTDVVVAHRYAPVAASSLDSWFPADQEPAVIPDTLVDFWDEHRDRIAAQRAQYCPEPQIEEAMRAQLAGATGLVGYSTFLSSEVDYILTTGAGWRGPIAQFTLVVEAEGPWDFVFLCLPGQQRVSHGWIEFSAQNYVPTQELSVYFARAVGEAIDAAGN
ncbi:DUF4424 family protein [Pararhodobacter sp.]|uniref:DUF4424 family protein n=1 Tax=Pararhodobacter sp. TaxID=2127056 RepID=UPI002AFF35CC|nr:DUF4424 family protein [Pararhodobacter sp.]